MHYFGGRGKRLKGGIGHRKHVVVKERNSSEVRTRYEYI